MMREQDEWLENRYTAAAKLQARTRGQQQRKRANTGRMVGSRLGGSAPAPAPAPAPALPARKPVVAKQPQNAGRRYVGKGATPPAAAAPVADGSAGSTGYVGKGATPVPTPAKDALAPENNPPPKPKPKPSVAADGTVEQQSNPMAFGGGGAAATGTDSPLKAAMSKKELTALDKSQRRSSVGTRSAILGRKGRGGRGGRGGKK